ncbi:hypothetical protein QTQ03_29975 [Micromonospora sp. WMMA1363]|uniref:hypothetical protein n=1 Tax=Micromonospora sp. WMMA1363 TaxID=3053985 RepID=UPI00259D01A1|nr:hypothetical protein [Micromonospora sp. WMMA1363]MDM4723436.1 hypothetical protein [Micromonospora sp. WMMA1363]MDM4723573.1 hypothetical protein [Micromonospora sp. WMMA1363]MDM4723592.1 hypothetical protein [Micromonospora sp. WMMA1363]
MTKTAWIRQAIEAALASRVEDDQMISRAEALRAIQLLPFVCQNGDTQKQEDLLVEKKMSTNGQLPLFSVQRPECSP